MSAEVLLSLVSFVFILGVLVLLRSRGKELLIKNTDVLVALIPILIYLFVSGQIKSITVGDFHLEAAFKEATFIKVEKSITNLPIELIPVGDKSTYEKIPDLIRSQTVGLRFEMNYPHYDKHQIIHYLDSLAKFKFFKYLIIENSDGAFVAMSDVDEFFKKSNKELTELNITKLIRAIETNNRKMLLQIPNFIGDVVTSDTKKKDALKIMQNNKAKTLPVVNEINKFVGVVTQENLATSLIIDMADQINK